MEEILHNLIGSSSHYLQFFTFQVVQDLFHQQYFGPGLSLITAFRGAEESFRKMMEAPISLGNFKTQRYHPPAFGEDF